MPSAECCAGKLARAFFFSAANAADAGRFPRQFRGNNPNWRPSVDAIPDAPMGRLSVGAARGGPWRKWSKRGVGCLGLARVKRANLRQSLWMPDG